MKLVQIDEKAILGLLYLLYLLMISRILAWLVTSAYILLHLVIKCHGCLLIFLNQCIKVKSNEINTFLGFCTALHLQSLTRPPQSKSHSVFASSFWQKGPKDNDNTGLQGIRTFHPDSANQTVVADRNAED